jgi:hypothetical protein
MNQYADNRDPTRERPHRTRFYRDGRTQDCLYCERPLVGHPDSTYYLNPPADPAALRELRKRAYGG